MSSSLLNEVTNISETVDKIISQGSQRYDKIPVEFADRKDEIRIKLINEGKKTLTGNITSQLQHLQDKIDSLEDENISEMVKTIYPLRSSKLHQENKIAGESEFQSAINLLNTRNEPVILNELRKASMNFARNEFSYTILEYINNFGLSDATINFAVEIMRKNDKIEYYLNYLRTGKEIERVRDKIAYHKRYLLAGTINKNYNLNKELRDKVKVM